MELIFLTAGLAVCDIVVGTAASFIGRGKHESWLSSSQMANGVVKKLVILLIVCISRIVGNYLGIPDMFTIITAFYITAEILSIIENSAKCGVPYPARLLNILKELNEKNS